MSVQRLTCSTQGTFKSGERLQSTAITCDVEIDLDVPGQARGEIHAALDALAFASAVWSEWGAAAQAKGLPGVDLGDGTVAS